MKRNLSSGEIAILGPIFGSTLRYQSIKCDVNSADVGGPSNSITPAGVAYFSRHLYNNDFSGEAPDYKWVFVHEMAHVWQWQHGIYPVWAAVGAFIENLGNYAKAYSYQIEKGKPFREYNLEQQAAIVADYWASQSRLLKPQCNLNTAATVADYGPLITQLQSVGRPKSHFDQPPF